MTLSDYSFKLVDDGGLTPQGRILIDELINGKEPRVPWNIAMRVVYDDMSIEEATKEEEEFLEYKKTRNKI